MSASLKNLQIVLIAPASVGHTVKWVNGLSREGAQVHLISQHAPLDSISERVMVHRLPYRGVLGYFLNAFWVNRLIKKIQPDVVNVHYATGYGTLALLANIRPYVLNVWGSDVYVAPYKSRLHYHLVRLSLKNAEHIASTSYAMAAQVRTLLTPDTQISITPFGVDTEWFRSTHEVFSGQKTVIGTAKSLEHKYGIDVLISGFKLAYEQCCERAGGKADLELVIAGDGSERQKLELLCKELEIEDRVTFLGRLPNEKIVDFINTLDIVVLSSRVESFGVAAVEASACERPCIVSRVGGLPEVIKHKETGLLIDSESQQQLAESIISLIDDPDTARRYGNCGRRLAIQCYSETAALDIMSDVLISARRSH